jgi:hypothetical protein
MSERDAVAYAERAVAELPENEDGVDRSASDWSRVVFALQWTNAGRVTLVTSHTYAAALAATSIPDPNVLAGTPLPSKAFRVQLPVGLVCDHVPGYAYQYTHANVFLDPDGRAYVALEGWRAGVGERRHVCTLDMYTPKDDAEDGLALLLADRSVDAEVDVQMPPKSDTYGSLSDAVKMARTRSSLVTRRIIAGLLLTYANTTNWKETTSGSRGTTKRHGPPPHRTIVVGRPLRSDFRGVIHAYLGGTSTKSPPSVQTLVRGHYKRQAFGHGRSERRVIWVEPYWRGPEGAPILSRPHFLTGGEA